MAHIENSTARHDPYLRQEALCQQPSRQRPLLGPQLQRRRHVQQHRRPVLAANSALIPLSHASACL